MPYKQSLIIVLCYFALSINSFASSKFEQELFSSTLFTSEANRKLPNKQVLRLEQDERGFIWVGTGKGVYRFDGYTYEKLEAANPSIDLSNVYVRSLLVVSDYLWIGTMSQGAFRVDLRTLDTIHFTHDTENADSLGGNQVNSIKTDQEGNIWLAHSFGLDKFNEQEKSFSHYFSGDEHGERYYNYLIDMEFDQTGNLWLSTAKGIANFKTEENSFFLFNKANYSEIDTNLLEGVLVRRFYLASDGRLWLATQKLGTYIFEPDSMKVTKLLYPENQSQSVNTAITEVAYSENDERRIWISGTTGIEIWDAKTGEFIKYIRGNPQDEFGLASDTVHALLRTHSGLIWLGVNDIGLQFYNPDTTQFLYFNRYSEKLSELFSGFINKVISLDSKNILVLTEKDVYSVNLYTGTVKNFLSDSEIPRKLSSALIDDTNYWFGDGDGYLYQVDSRNGAVIPYRLPLTQNEGVYVRHLEQGKQSELWIGTDRGLVKLNRETKTLSTLINEDGSRFISFVKNLFVDSQNRVWIATTSGIGVVESNSNVVKVYTTDKNTDNTLRHNAIYQILENHNGDILVFNRAGIDRLVEDSSEFKRFSPFAIESADQMDSEDRLLQLKNGNYWLGHSFLLDLQGNTIDSFSAKDGALHVGRGNQLFDFDDNYLMRVTPSRIIIINKQGRVNERHAPNIVVTNLSINNKTAQYSYANPKIKLLPDQDSFTVSFASLDLSEPEHIQYRYKLDGYDSEWITTSSDIRQAKYTSIYPGYYTLLIEGTNRQGAWSPHTLSIDVSIEPKYFQTLWFRLLIGLLATILLILFFRWRLAVANRKQQQVFEQEQAIQKAEMISELMEQKNRLFAEVTHDLRTPLASIKVQLEAMQDGVLDTNEKTYDSIQNRISNLNHLVGDLYQLSTLETGSFALKKRPLELSSWLDELVNSFKPMLMTKNLKLDFKNNIGREQYINVDKERLSQVISNLLNNSYRYTHPDGQVIVTLTVIEKVLQIQVEDSAPSVSNLDIDKIFNRQYRAKSEQEGGASGSGLGLWICQSIVSAHGGSISASQSAIGGLLITIQLPI
ncbi:MAG TPA: two-component regulator propeller domain-containing protein [Kangiella sp.]